MLPDTPDKIKILDIGTGTGVWAAEMAKRWPNANVIATDLTLPPQRDDTPSNLDFVRHNANDSAWPFESFHFIHARMVDAGIHDWPTFRATCFRHLVPGGSFELAHITQPMHSKLPEFDTPSASPFLRLMHLITLASKNGGIDYDVSSKHLEGLRDVGFDEVEETTIMWPLGSWPQNEDERKIGVLSLQNTLRLIDSAAKFILTHQNFMGDEEANDVIQAGRDDLLQTEKKQFYMIMYVKHSSLTQFHSRPEEWISTAVQVISDNSLRKLFTAKKPCSTA